MQFRKDPGLASCTSYMDQYDADKYAMWRPCGDYESAMIELNEEFPGIDHA
jgi:hypothetical protein